jgi:hypothetical protein
LHDSCGILNLHGIPSLIGSFAGVAASSFAKVKYYGTDSLREVFMNGADKDWSGAS